MTAHQLINQTSNRVDFHTPQSIIEAARRTMGSIDLDPASSEVANKWVQAAKFYTEEDDGLEQPWVAHTLWMNHPFGRKTNQKWIDRLTGACAYGLVGQACCITFACTSEQWFKPLLNYPQCFLVPRTNYLLPDGSIMRGVTKGSVVTYLCNSRSESRVERFAAEFSSLGVVKIPYGFKV